MQSKIKAIGEFDRLDDAEKDMINERLAKFEEKHEGDFSEMHLKLDCHRQKEKTRGRSAYICKLNIDSDNGRYHANNQDFGAEQTVIGALDKIERQMQKKI